MSIRPRVWKNKDGSETKEWVVDYKDNGGTRRNLQFEKKREAEQRWAKIQIELGLNTHTPNSLSPTVSEAAELL